MKTDQFFQALFANGLSNKARLPIWSLPSKRTRFHTTAQDAAQDALSRDDEDVYFGLALVEGNPAGRGEYADTAGIGCLWADIDIAHGVHPKPNLPPNATVAYQVLAKAGPPPSIIVNTGHGLQVYWLLTEFWRFTDGDQRLQAANLSARWVATLRAVAHKMGYDLDAVGDLPRVFRVPGTTNRKELKAHMAVTIVADDVTHRYAMDDLAMWMIDESHQAAAPPGSRAEVVIDPVQMEREASPPAEKLTVLLENDTRFRRTWERKRKDLADQSPSAYDMALAHAAAEAGLTHQETADLIIAWRRKHKADVGKALRRDYMQRTLGRAYARAASDAAMRQVDQVAAGIPAEGKLIGAKRADALNALNHALRINPPITELIQHGTEKGTADYAMKLADGREVRIGGVDTLASRLKFRNRLLEAVQTVVHIPEKRWNNILDVIAATVTVIPDEETDVANIGHEWVCSYLRHAPAAVIDGDWREAATAGHPYIFEDHLCISMRSLRDHVRLVLGERGTIYTEVTKVLRYSGFTCVAQMWRDPNYTKMYRKIWRAPAQPYIDQGLVLTLVQADYQKRQRRRGGNDG